MAKIITKYGEMEESMLVKTSGVDENDNERVEWEEWRLGDDIVKRGVHVHLKTNVAADSIAAMLN